ncbi:hypothetical protein MBLNU457_7668t1 [Dothideomycetes sp. NU457]
MTNEQSNPSLDQFNAFPLTALDREMLAMTDDEFTPHSWTNIIHLVDKNRLEDFKRYPSDLRRYLLWSQKTKAEYGSITNFVIMERLHWTPTDAKATPPVFEVRDQELFADENDFKVLRNDWPYGLDRGITHLVVWLKNVVPIDEATGDLTTDSRRDIHGFVEERFKKRLENVSGVSNPSDHVVWFKNPVALQSVRGVDHVHVMVRNVPEEIIDEWTA